LLSFRHDEEHENNFGALGGSFGGKTKACKILAASLQAVKGSTGKAPTCVLLNPKSVKIDQVTTIDQDISTLRWHSRLHNDNKQNLVFNFKKGRIDVTQIVHSIQGHTFLEVKTRLSFCPHNLGFSMITF